MDPDHLEDGKEETHQVIWHIRNREDDQEKGDDGYDDDGASSPIQTTTVLRPRRIEESCAEADPLRPPARPPIFITKKHHENQAEVKAKFKEQEEKKDTKPRRAGIEDIDDSALKAPIRPQEVRAGKKKSPGAACREGQLGRRFTKFGDFAAASGSTSSSKSIATPLVLSRGDDHGNNSNSPAEESARDITSSTAQQEHHHEAGDEETIIIPNAQLVQHDDEDVEERIRREVQERLDAASWPVLHVARAEAVPAANQEEAEEEEKRKTKMLDGRAPKFLGIRRSYFLSIVVILGMTGTAIIVVIVLVLGRRKKEQQAKQVSAIEPPSTCSEEESATGEELQCCDPVSDTKGILCCGKYGFDPEDSKCCLDGARVVGKNDDCCSWELVAHVSQSLSLFEYDSDLEADRDYGTFVEDPSPLTLDFQRSFSFVPAYIKLVTGNKAHSAIYNWTELREVIDSREEIYGPNIEYLYSNNDGEEYSYESKMGSVLSRSYRPEDPLIDLHLFHCEWDCSGIIWGENAVTIERYGNFTDANKGVNVYISACLDPKILAQPGVTTSGTSPTKQPSSFLNTTSNRL